MLHLQVQGLFERGQRHGYSGKLPVPEIRAAALRGQRPKSPFQWQKVEFLALDIAAKLEFCALRLGELGELVQHSQCKLDNAHIALDKEEGLRLPVLALELLADFGAGVLHYWIHHPCALSPTQKYVVSIFDPGVNAAKIHAKINPVVSQTGVHWIFLDHRDAEKRDAVLLLIHLHHVSQIPPRQIVEVVVERNPELLLLLRRQVPALLVHVLAQCALLRLLLGSTRQFAFRLWWLYVWALALALDLQILLACIRVLALALNLQILLACIRALALDLRIVACSG